MLLFGHMNDALLWQAAAHPTRRRLIELLRDGPKTTGELCRGFSTTRFAVMKHLAVLERAGVVAVRRAGRQRWNVLDAGQLRRLGHPWGWPGSRQPADERLPEGQPRLVGPVGLVHPGLPAEAGGPAAEQDGAAAGQREAAVEQDLSPALLYSFIDAPPWRVFDALTVHVAAWWGAPHLCSPDASNLVIEPQPGGRFVEEWGHRQGTLRGQVTAIRQDERVELTGAVLGASRGVLDIRLEGREGGTGLRASLRLESGGRADAEDARGAIDDLLGRRLKVFVERGERSGVVS
jgi:DNA-binding transcriptional ArsR family regulator/uncharacterized protein YndB with AHSA1/START domain